MDETHAASAATSRGQRRSPWLLPGVLALILAFLTVSVLAHSPVLDVDRWIRGAVQARAHSARFRWLEGYRYAPVYLLVDLGNNQVAVPVLGLSALIAAIRDRSVRPLLAAAVGVGPEMTPDFVKMLQGHDWPGNVRELENYIARAVVLSRGKPLTPDLLAAPGRNKVKRWKPLKAHGGDLQSLIQQLVRLGIQTLPEGSLNDRVVGAVERELIEQVLAQCDDVQVTAARKLGINRNTLHKKVSAFNAPTAEADKEDEGAA